MKQIVAKTKLCLPCFQLDGQTRLTGWPFRSTGLPIGHPVNMLGEALRPLVPRQTWRLTGYAAPNIMGGASEDPPLSPTKNRVKHIYSLPLRSSPKRRTTGRILTVHCKLHVCESGREFESGNNHRLRLQLQLRSKR